MIYILVSLKEREGFSQNYSILNNYGGKIELIVFKDESKSRRKTMKDVQKEEKRNLMKN